MPPTDDASIILLERFIQATRDAGYKGTPSALAELVDNSLQAGASTIRIKVLSTPENQLEVAVLDNGSGMDKRTLRQSLRFGGSSRFNDRSSLGRYGMGLPNASLSQARRVDVFSWQEGRPPWSVHLDLDEIADGSRIEIPVPKQRACPPVVEEPLSRSGTLILWRKCDRLDNRRVSTIVEKLVPTLGRVFRYFIWDGVSIRVNEHEVPAVDPLMLDSRSVQHGARQFGETMAYELRVGRATQSAAKVLVRFSELPVHEWGQLSNEEKARIGITKGSGVSVVRAGREIDCGWFFMGSKRRENYDDWWRCEVRFEPELDELFGITFTKQQVHPRGDLLKAISADIEATARALNSRVRQAHVDARTRQSLHTTEALATRVERHLPRLPTRATRGRKSAVDLIVTRRPEIQAQLRAGSRGDVAYAIIHEPLDESSFFAHETDGDRFILRINSEHPFYRKIYKPLLDQGHEAARQLELMVLSAARQQAAARGSDESEALNSALIGWSKILALYLNA